MKAKIIDIKTDRRLVLLNSDKAAELGLKLRDVARVTGGSEVVSATVNITDTLVGKDEIGIYSETARRMRISDGTMLDLSLLPRSSSVQFIRKKMKGQRLTGEEIHHVVQDIVDQRLSEIEIAAFVTAQEYHGMDMDEIESMTRATVETGNTIEFDRPVFDKHSLGGVPGNKVSLLIVPIVAATGVLIPKTSSKAITSPSGTAETMNMLAEVDFAPEELKAIVKKTGAAIVWGGSLNLAPADDIIIGVEHLLEIDPESQMLASIMAKKLAVGTDFLVMDLPTGRESKVETTEQARHLSHLFVELGERLGMRVRCGVTYGGQPVGHAVGPALEAREALEALAGHGPSSLVEKSTALAGLLLELAGKASRGRGSSTAREILSSGKALDKMKEIIEAQGGNPGIRPEDLPVGSHRAELLAPCDGYAVKVSNKAINAIARTAGAPGEKGAGIVLHGKEGQKIRRDEKIMEIYAERESKLDEAYQLALKLKPITIEGMLIEELPEY
ncbi:MAG: AMP phosphorylase [archaeon]